MCPDALDRGIESVKGIGPARAKIYGRLGIRTIREALYYLPFRYEDRSVVTNICNIRDDCFETVRGAITSASLKGGGPGPRNKGRTFELLLNDGTGIIKARWFNQPFLQKNFRVGDEIMLSGHVKRRYYKGWETVIENPEYEVAGAEDILVHTGRIVPVYRLTEGISLKQFRKTQFAIVQEYAKDISDIMPRDIVERNSLPSLQSAVAQLHFPGPEEDIETLNSCAGPYHRRLAFDELFLFELGAAMRKKSRQAEKGRSFMSSGALEKRLLGSLSFDLTASQRKVIDEILSDMRQPVPMSRLLQGDVGCGKTIVAVIAMLHAVECGCQAVLMAPTEILAAQHYLNIKSMVEGLGLKISLLTAGAERRQCEGIDSGEIQIIVGTHAVIQERVVFNKLGLAVIDEQHKFGVVQRGLLKTKGANPDILVMTATPIPRSLAITLYGDLDYSVVDQMPSGRASVATKVFNPDDKTGIYGLLKSEILKGRQAYVVYPAIEDSEAGLKSAILGREAFQGVFPEFKIGLLHGRLGAAEKESVMKAFAEGKIDILVSTTVIEVGVDVSNATIMLIVHAERFGLAQLHQLRGRVGRGAETSYCLLVAYGPLGDDARRRLDIMVSTGDGFRISEEDLAIRGPGDFFGTRQAGMPDLRFADLVRDRDLLETARREAANVIEADPGMKKFASLRKAVDVFWKTKNEFGRTV